MMNRLILSVLLLCLGLSQGQLSAQSPTGNSGEGRRRVLVETSKGKFVLELFNETPRHRDAFLKNVEHGVYDGTLFHRVIKNFMIQGGNPLSKGIKAKEAIPEDSVATAEEIAPEFLPATFVHTRGMLAAARQGDDVNPEKRSSPTQFYIVTGKYYTELDLQKEELRHGVKYSPEQRKAYMIEGGAAHLDGGYTIFGRLLDKDGWSAVDKIQRVETDEEDRPIKNIIIKKMTLLP